MKFSLSLISICILSFILVYSCSTEEEDSVTPVSVAPVEYTLTVSAAEGGTVSTEGGTYEEGTNITITATANEGYRFIGWEGNDSTSESLTITLKSNQTYQALFLLTNPLAAMDISLLEHIESSEGFKFYYNISNNLPEDWIEEFKSIMNYLNELIPVKSRISSTPRDGKSEMHIFSWTSIEESPFKEIIGDASGACICGNEYGRYMLLEINNNEFIYNNSHRFLVIVHEYFHTFQINASQNEPPFLKFLMEGAAATLESLYSQEFFNENYFLDAQKNVTNNAISSPHLFEEHGEPEINYADSVFIFLALVKELQTRNNISEIEALKKVYVEWWKSGRDGLVTKEILFEQVFGFSLNSFYESLKSYTPDINTVLPSENIRLEEIFEEL